MKKVLLFAASVAVLAACTKDATVDNGVVNPYGGVSFIGNAEGTRTSLTENASNGLDIKWAVGDQIGVFAEDANGTIATNSAFSAQTVGTSSEFIPASASDKIIWGTGSHNFYAYYPKSTATDPTAIPASVPAVQTQSVAGNTDHLAPLAFLWAKNEGITKPSDNAIALQFSNVFSVLELQISSEIGDVDCSGIVLKFSDPNEIASASGAKVNVKTGVVDYSSATTSNQIRLNLTTPVTLTSGTINKFYMIVTPGHEASRFSVYAIVNGIEVKLGSTGMPVGGLPAGVKASLTLGVPAVDLSENGTANCYIVNEGGVTYKFKATVMGNGATTTSITPATLSPSSAELLWTSSYNSTTFNSVGLTNVELKSGYIYFTTPSVLINGNACIAALDASSNIVWSWHLWIADSYQPDATSITTSTGANSYVTPATWMDRNLGAQTAAARNLAQPEKAYGLYYQWGRKDPMAGYNNLFTFSDNTTSGTARNYNNKQTTMTATTVAEAVAWTIKNPDKFVNAGTTQQWTNSSSAQAITDWGYLWGNPDGTPTTYAATPVVTTEGSKSIYDPCPVGWKIPAHQMFAFVNTPGGDNAGAYHSGNAYEYNMLEVIEESAGTTSYIASAKLTSTNKTTAYPFDGTSLSFFTKTHNASGVPADPTSATINFPLAGSRSYGIGYLNRDGLSSPDGAIGVYATNSPKSAGATTWAGSLYLRPSTGDILFKNYTIATQDALQACGISVRCVKDGISSYDLDNATDLSANGTANCYIVNAPNKTYKFKATVKGNGKVQNVYANRACSSSWSFVKGTPATDQTTVTIAPKSAALLWYMAWPSGSAGYVKTCPIVVSSVKLKDGYIYFNTPSSFTNGNAVIAAYRGTDIVWSWHIWAAEGYDPIATEKKLGTTSTGYVMDRNIGAAIATDNSNGWIAASASGMYYQHGRKDPFTGPLDLAASDGNRGGVGIGALKPDGTLMYGSNGTGGSGVDGGYWYIQSSNYLVGIAQALGSNTVAKFATAADYSVKNPEKLIHNYKQANASPYDWWGARGSSDANFMYYWGMSQWKQYTNVATKTIYDPCPAGWIVPSSDFSALINSSTIAATTYGWNVTAASGDVIYFPKTGMRGADNPGLSSVSTVGTCWINAIGDNGCGNMFFNGSAFYCLGGTETDGTNKAYAGMGVGCRPIRCVQEGFR